MKKIISLTLLLIIILPINVVANTVIHNSVSVTASGGTTSTKIKTVHNGEVVEDVSVSTNTPYQHQSTYSNKTEQNNTEITQTDEAIIIQLQSLINELRLILSFYEKLLAQQGAQ